MLAILLISVVVMVYAAAVSAENRFRLGDAKPVTYLWVAFFVVALIGAGSAVQHWTLIESALSGEHYADEL